MCEERCSLQVRLQLKNVPPRLSGTLALAVIAARAAGLGILIADWPAADRSTVHSLF